MKRLLLALSISLIALPAMAADYRYSVPLPRPAPEAKFTDASVYHLEGMRIAALHRLAQTNPDPFNTQRAQVQQPTQQQQQPSFQQAQPVVIAPQIDTNPGLLSWLIGSVVSLAGGAFGFNQLRQGIQKPGLDREGIRQAAKQAALEVIDSGIPGGILQTAANRVPILGGIVEQLRPMIREELRERLGGQTGGAPAPIEQSVPQGLDAWKAQLLAEVGNIVQARIETAFAKRAQP